MIKYYKSVTEDLKSHSLQYQLNTLIVDPKPFDPAIECGNGIYFCTIDNILYWTLNLRYTHIVEVTLPEDARKSKSLDGTKWKCDRIVLSNMKNILDFIKEHMNEISLNPFHYVIKTNNEEIVKILLANNNGVTSIINEKNNHGSTALHYACEWNNTKMAAMLLANGAVISINERDIGGYVALHYACHWNNNEMVIMLLANGATANIGEKNSIGHTTLHYACKYNNKKMVTLLLANGAAIGINDKNYYGYTALEYACQFNNKEIIAMLLTNGAEQIQR